MLLMADLANTKCCKNLKNDRNPSKWIVSSESTQRNLPFCASGKSSISMVRVKPASAQITTLP